MAVDGRLFCYFLSLLLPYIYFRLVIKLALKIYIYDTNTRGKPFLNDLLTLFPGGPEGPGSPVGPGDP